MTREPSRNCGSDVTIANRHFRLTSHCADQRNYLFTIRLPGLTNTGTMTQWVAKVNSQDTWRDYCRRQCDNL